MRNPLIKIYRKIHKDTSGGRMYGRRELKKRLKVELQTKWLIHLIHVVALMVQKILFLLTCSQTSIDLPASSLSPFNSFFT